MKLFNYIDYIKKSAGGITSKTKIIIRKFFDQSRSLSVEVQRSKKWPTFRKKFLIKYPKCSVCDGTEMLEAHHVTPFHLNKSLELVESNIITLCEKNHCHLIFGHLGDWSSYNPDVRQDAQIMLNKVKNRP